MQIPKLANAERRREFDDYSHEEHVKVYLMECLIVKLTAWF